MHLNILSINATALVLLSAAQFHYREISVEIRRKWSLKDGFERTRTITGLLQELTSGGLRRYRPLNVSNETGGQLDNATWDGGRTVD